MTKYTVAISDEELSRRIAALLVACYQARAASAGEAEHRAPRATAVLPGDASASPAGAEAVR